MPITSQVTKILENDIRVLFDRETKIRTIQLEQILSDIKSLNDGGASPPITPLSGAIVCQNIPYDFHRRC